jgi:hypothetical protein
MSGFAVFITILLTAFLVSGIWLVVYLRAQKNAAVSAQLIKSLEDQLVETRADMEHHRDSVFEAMAEGVMLCDLLGELFS